MGTPDAVEEATEARGDPVPIVGLTAITGVFPSLPSLPVDPLGPGEPDGPGEPTGITNDNLFSDELHETEGLAPAEVGDAVTVEIGAVSSSSQTTFKTLLTRVNPETFSVSSH